MINRRKYISHLFVGICLSLVHILGAQGNISVESKVDRSKIFIGDVVRYSLIITHDIDVKVSMPSPAANLGQFEIRSYKVQEAKKQDNKIISQADYFISTFDIGEYEIPPLGVEYFVGNDTTLKTIKTEPIKITVQSLNPSETGDIRDIKPPITPPIDYKRIVLISLGLILLLAAVSLILWYLKRRREGKSLLPTRQEPPRPAHELALEALNKLVNSDWIAAGRLKEYHSDLADILRKYVENRFFIEAMELTTDEVIASMRTEDLDGDAIKLLLDILQPCDLVKFAKYVPPEEEIKRLTADAFTFINSTKLILVEEPTMEGKSEGPLEAEATVPVLTEIEEGR